MKIGTHENKAIHSAQFLHILFHKFSFAQTCN